MQGVDYGEGAPADTPTFEEIMQKESDPTQGMPEPDRLAFRGIGYSVEAQDG